MDSKTQEEDKYGVWEQVGDLRDQIQSSVSGAVDVGAEAEAVVQEKEVTILTQETVPSSQPAAPSQPKQTDTTTVEQEQTVEEAPIFDFTQEQVQSLVANGAFRPRPVGGTGICEKYALLGDRVLNLFIVESLVERETKNAPYENPEAWIKRIAAIYQAPSVMVRLSDELNLTEMVRTIVGDESIILGNSAKCVVIKAMVGATFRVQGETRARECVINIMKYVDAELVKRQKQLELNRKVDPNDLGDGQPQKLDIEVPTTRLGVKLRSAASVLRNWFQRRNLPQPVFDTQYVFGPPHRPEFVCTVEYCLAEIQEAGGYVPVGQETMKSARRITKKAAMESAAITVLQALDVPVEVWAEAALLDSQSSDQVRTAGEAELRLKRRRDETDAYGMPAQQYIFSDPSLQV